MPTPEQIKQKRAEMANAMNAEHNAAVMDGRVTHGDGLIPVEGIGGHGTPTVPEIAQSSADNDPYLQAPGLAVAPTAPAPQPPAQVPAEGAPADGSEQPKKWFGKYESEQEAEKGYYQLLNTHTAALQRLSALENQQVGTPQPQPGPTPMLPGPTPGSRERVDPTAPQVNWSENQAVHRAAEETGVEARIFADFAKGIADEVQAKADVHIQQVVQQQLQPLSAAADADAYMRQKYPDHVNHIAEVGIFAEANPHIKDAATALAATGKQREAQEYLWNSYQLQTGIGLQNRMQVNAVVAEEETQIARANAGLPSSPSTPVHAAAQNQNQPSQEQLNTWLAAYRAGDKRAGDLWRRATLAPELIRQGFDPKGFSS